MGVAYKSSSLLYIFTLLVTSVTVIRAQNLAVLSPVANQTFHPGDTILFEYVPLDHTFTQLNIFLDSFGTQAAEIPIKLAADISKYPNGTYSVAGKTYNKYSFNYGLSTSTPVEGQQYQVSFETSQGDMLIPIIVKASESTSAAIIPTFTSSTFSNSLSRTTSAALVTSSSSSTTLSSSSISSSSSSSSSSTSSSISSSYSSSSSTSTSTSTASSTASSSFTNATVISTAFSSSAVATSSTSLFTHGVTNVTSSSTSSAAPSQTPMVSSSVISTIPPSSSLSSSPFTSSVTTTSSSIHPSSTATSLSATGSTHTQSVINTRSTGSVSATLLASSTPIPPDPKSFMSASTRLANNSEFSLIAATLFALLLVRLLLV